MSTEITCSRCDKTFKQAWTDDTDDDAWAVREETWRGHDPLKFGVVCDDCFGDLVLALRCRVCGCTELKACVSGSGVKCHWIEDDLCSFCRGVHQPSVPTVAGNSKKDGPTRKLKARTGFSVAIGVGLLPTATTTR